MNQLLLFEDPKSEYDVLWEAIEKLKQSGDKTRKRLFAEIKDLQEQLITVKAENERIKFHAGMQTVIRWTA